MDVAILGGGVAGLATAISLRRLGMTVDVFERRESVHGLGAGIVCWPNASFVLSELGILDELRSLAGTTTAMRRISIDGTELGRLDIRLIDEAMGYPSLPVLRKDLMQVLLRRTEELGVSIHYNANAVGIASDSDGRRVQFSNGLTISPAIVIGADGRMNSIARRYVAKVNRPVFQGFVNWIGIYHSDVALFDHAEIGDYWGLGARFGIVPISAHTAYWAAGIAVLSSEAREVGEDIVRLRQAFDGWPSPIGDIILNTTESNIKRVVLYDHNPMPTWHKDNVLLVGDAAHAALPTSGQGAAQALEDAWCLAHEFATSHGSPDDIMAAFTQRRLAKTTGIIMGGRAFASMLFNKDPAECKARDRDAMQADYATMAIRMATGWSAGLPLGL
ncbi:FAD-dependent monooxygenase [Aeoliella sp. ICT_H6.2]|uniref:FAD-dependent monooxygenase n=1 Tax=Aeoliella straminimaris TaxID=2954799 RepID=A0A9X2FCY0_9BACT|nr:FAD-dependent monooxygenase [Aeoliella straminimaris]MCO6046650.1 FAD-dependent monooxygenase [Aeoliella straminimaris]